MGGGGGEKKQTIIYAREGDWKKERVQRRSEEKIPAE